MSVAIEPCPLLVDVGRDIVGEVGSSTCGTPPPAPPPTHPNYHGTHEHSLVHLGVTSRHGTIVNSLTPFCKKFLFTLQQDHEEPTQLNC